MSEEERTEVFRGHWDECLRHYATELGKSTPRGARGAFAAKEPMAAFCGVTAHTVNRWFNSEDSSNKAVPEGETLLRLMIFLDFTGYKVIELDRLPDIRRHYAELVGYRVMTLKEAAQAIDYTNTKDLYRVLLGRGNPNEDKEQKMFSIWKSRRKEVELKKEEYRSGVAPGISTPSSAGFQTEMNLLKPGKNRRPEAIVKIMEGLLVLLEEKPYDSLLPSEIKELRSAAGTVLRLSARFSSLGSRLLTDVDQKEEGGNE